MLKKLLIIAIPLLIAAPVYAGILDWFRGTENIGGDGTITRLDQWASTSTPQTSITQRVMNTALRLTGLGAAGGCLSVDANGIVSASGVACGTSGSGGGQWATSSNATLNIYPNGGTNIGVGVGSSTPYGQFSVESNNTTTTRPTVALKASSLQSADLVTGYKDDGTKVFGVNVNGTELDLYDSANNRLIPINTGSYLAFISSAWQILNQNAATVASVIRGFTGQSADLTRWQDIDNNILAVVNKDGWIGISTTSPGTRLGVTGEGVFTGRVTAPSYNATSTTAASTFPYASTTAVTVGSLAGSGTKCVQADNNGLLSLALDTCGSGTGGSKWATSSGSTITPNGGGGVLVTSSSTIGSGTPIGGLTINGGSTTTGSSLIQGNLNITGNATATNATTTNSFYTQTLKVNSADGQLGLYVTAQGGNPGNPIYVTNQFGTDLFVVDKNGVATFDTLQVPNANGGNNYIGGYIANSDAKTTLQTGTAGRAPIGTLDLYNNTTPQIAFQKYTIEGGGDRYRISGYYTDWIDNTAAARTGKLKLTINDFNAERTVLTASTTGSALYIGLAEDQFRFSSNGTSSIPYASTTALSVSGSGSAFVVSSGNVGIGTSTPLSLLSLNKSQSGLTTIGDARVIALQNSSGSANQLQEIGFGFQSVASNHSQPVVIGHRVTSGSANSMGDFYIATRAVTTDTFPTERLTVTAAGNVGVGTTTPQWLLNPFSATAPQLALSAGAGIAQWTMRNAGGNLYFATTTVAGTATTSTSALSLFSSGVPSLQIGTTTPQNTLKNGSLVLGGGGDSAGITGSTTIQMAKIQFDGQNSTGGRVCLFIVGTTPTVSSGACNP